MDTKRLPASTIVVFGITGNLAQIKLLPAIYDLVDKGLLSPKTKIIGIGRTPHTKESFNKYLHDTLLTKNHHHAHEVNASVIKQIISQTEYISGNVDSEHPESIYPVLTKKLKNNMIYPNNYLYYLATFPELYGTIFKSLDKYDLDRGSIKLLIEKPFGNDLLSSKKLNRLLHKYFDESQIYRVDHYLGKETLQHILTFRFGNDLFEPLINSNYLDSIQITSSETFGIEKRGEYYDKVGALKDVGQNHLLQMLAISTMEAPSEFSNKAVTQNRLNIISTLEPEPATLVLGQYGGYHKEEKVSPKSNTDTFFAFRTHINNERFENVPIYIRGGKKLKQNVSQITFIFKSPINRLFDDISGEPFSNVLFYRLQPNEGIGIGFLTKKPGHSMEAVPATLEYCYKRSMGNYIPDAYEKLLYAAIMGDQTFFNDASEVEAQWAFVEHMLEKTHKVHTYPEGTWGPKMADKLIEKDGREWIEPSADFCKI